MHDCLLLPRHSCIPLPRHDCHPLLRRHDSILSFQGVITKKSRCDYLGFIFFFPHSIHCFNIKQPSNSFQTQSFYDLTILKSSNIKLQLRILQKLMKKPNLLLNFVKILPQIWYQSPIGFCPATSLFL